MLDRIESTPIEKAPLVGTKKDMVSDNVLKRVRTTRRGALKFLIGALVLTSAKPISAGYNCSPSPTCKNHVGKGVHYGGSKFDGKWDSYGFPDEGWETNRYGKIVYLKNGLTYHGEVINYSPENNSITTPPQSSEGIFTSRDGEFHNGHCSDDRSVKLSCNPEFGGYGCSASERGRFKWSTDEYEAARQACRD